jgi:hypothetical protein
LGLQGVEMSQVNTNAIYDASGGQSAKLYGVSMRNGGTGWVNRIINGDMRIDQRNAGASVTITNTAAVTYTLDRWAAYGSQASKFSVQQNAGSVTPPSGFTNYLGATSLSAYSVGSSENFTLTQNIEGFNTADLGWGAAGAQAITLSFLVRSSLTGTFGGALVNSAVNRSYPFSYTISAANTWEQKTITVAGDTSGTWVTNNGVGIRCIFGLGVGSSGSGTAGAWAGTLYQSATGATSVVGTSGATFYITGVQLEAGSVASPFERRDYGRELIMCQRYFQKWDFSSTYNGSNGQAVIATKWSASDVCMGNVSTYAPFRVAPTVSSSVATARYVALAGGNTMTLVNISAMSNGPLVINTTNNGVGVSSGWLDNFGVISASAEL